MERDITERLKDYDQEISAIGLRACVRDAIAEIERLRSLAGAVSVGPDYAEIRQSLAPGARSTTTLSSAK